VSEPLLLLVSEGSYRNAVADGAAHELASRGIALAGPVRCRLTERSATSLAVACDGRTADGRPVVVTGTADGADTDRPRERYRITVGGRQVLDADCLGAGCHR
jgi:hypothetical protein